MIIRNENKKLVNLWFESHDILLIFSHICLFLLPQACTLGCCDYHIAITLLSCVLVSIPRYVISIKMVMQLSASHLVEWLFLLCMQCTPLNPYSTIAM
jgi:hypothetical protein